MKRLLMLLMLWTGLMTAVYIVDAAKLSRDASTTYTDNSNIVSADAVDLSYTDAHKHGGLEVCHLLFAVAKDKGLRISP